ncbi:MAG: ATP-binding protein [Candidatus Deferrimicrobiaceae bacterium]
MRPPFSFLRGTVARRILALFLLCALLPIGSLAAFSLWEMSGTLKDQTEQRLHRASKNINMALLQGLGFLQTEMEVLAKSSDGRPEKSSGHFLGLTLFREGSGPRTIFGTPCPPPSLTGTMRAHLGKGLAAIFTEGVPGALSRVYMAVSARRGTLGHGILVGEIDPKYLGEIIESAMPLEGDLTVLDSTGAPVYNLKSLPPDVVRRATEQLRRVHSGWFEWNRDGNAVLVNYRSIFLGAFFNTNSWTLVFLTSKAWMFAPLRSFTRMFLLIVVLTLLVVSFLSITQIRRQLSPLGELTEGTRRISRGEFDSRVDIRSGDEFEELASSFNTMTENLEAQFRALREANLAMELEIAERKQAEEQLRQSQKMEAIGSLTGGIAHDFNNLLTVINGYSRILLQQVGTDGPIRKEIEGINDAGERAASLVNQLLTFSRKRVLEPKVIDLNRVLSDIDMMLRRLIGENIDMSTIPAEALGSVKADLGQIEQVVVNLAVNARDAMPGGGKLTIETANLDIDDRSVSLHPVGSPGKYVTLRVSDTGCGMDVKIRSRVFEPFFTTKPPGKGTGLGLSTVYGIVRQSQGHIHLESEVGKGTTFTMYLPRVEAPVEEQCLPERAPVDDRKGTETLLVAEDEDLVRDLVRTILTARGYKVLEARDGNESIEIGTSHEGPIHLLLTDMGMPHMSGQEVAKRLMEVRPGIKTLFMSGYREDSGNGDEGPYPEASFIQKPFRPDALARKVRELLDG